MGLVTRQVRNLGPRTFLLPPREQLYQRYCSNKHTHILLVLKFNSPLPEDHRVNILSTADSHCVDSVVLQTRRRLRLDPRHQCLPKIEVG